MWLTFTLTKLFITVELNVKKSMVKITLNFGDIKSRVERNVMGLIFPLELIYKVSFKWAP